MSRVGKQPIKVPSGVKVELKEKHVRVEGPKGKLHYTLPEAISAKLEGGVLKVESNAQYENAGALHGLNRTQLRNMVEGVTQGFSKELEISGIGYRAQVKGNTLSLTLGYSHNIDYKLPEGIQAKVDNNTKVTITGADKSLVGLVASNIRAFKKPDPYQAKGVKYIDEVIIRKQGKAATGGAK